MKRRTLVFAFTAILLLLVVPVALAYTSASGQVNDVNGNPWTHGGTIVCVQNSSQAVIGNGTINPDGSWSVTLGSPAAATCTIDPAPGPNGDPASFTCAIPGGGGGGVQDYACAPTNIPTGPNAVTLSSFAGQPFLWGWIVASTAVIGGAVVWLRRK